MGEKDKAQGFFRLRSRLPKVEYHRARKVPCPTLLSTGITALAEILEATCMVQLDYR